MRSRSPTSFPFRHSPYKVNYQATYRYRSYQQYMPGYMITGRVLVYSLFEDACMEYLTPVLHTDIAGLSMFSVTSTAYIAFTISSNDINQRNNIVSSYISGGSGSGSGSGSESYSDSFLGSSQGGSVVIYRFDSATLSWILSSEV